jgi:hypothetical protein
MHCTVPLSQIRRVIVQGISRVRKIMCVRNWEYEVDVLHNPGILQFLPLGVNALLLDHEESYLQAAMVVFCRHKSLLVSDAIGHVLHIHFEEADGICRMFLCGYFETLQLDNFVVQVNEAAM